MSVGFPSDKSTLDARAGSLAMGLRDTLRQIVSVKAWLDGQTDAQLLGLGYIQAEVTTLRASFTDMSKLSDIANALAVQAATSNFFFNAGKLLGLS